MIQILVCLLFLPRYDFSGGYAIETENGNTYRVGNKKTEDSNTALNSVLEDIENFINMKNINKVTSDDDSSSSSSSSSSESEDDSDDRSSSSVNINTGDEGDEDNENDNKDHDNDNQNAGKNSF